MSLHYVDDWLTVYHGDCREVMAGMEPESVHCVVTSPPYWGLRDYGEAGQMGLERTPDEYVAGLVAVFREVWRVLRKDGTVWLNLGSSYASHDPGGYREGEFLNPGGRAPAKGQARNRAGSYVAGASGRSRSRQPDHAPAYGTDGTGPSDSQDLGSAYHDLCGECRAALSSRTTDTLRPLPDASPLPSQTDRDSERPGSGLERLAASPLDVQASTTPRSELLPGDRCSHCGNCGACLSVLRSSSRDARECGRKSWLNYPTFKPKDMVPIPWMVAMSLQADGWYLRCDIVWSKPNPMPESIRDRPTKSHEYLFLLAKERRYYYDAAAIREPAESGPSDLRKMAESRERIGGLTKVADDPLLAGSALTNLGRKRAVGGAALKQDGQPQISGGDRMTGFNERWDASVGRGRRPSGWADSDDGSRLGRYDTNINGPTTLPPGRNRRSVWTIATEPYPGAHFATFPTRLVEPCILAGAPLGGVVLDPFAGSGTVGLVAQRLGRKAVLIDLSEEYLAQAIKRIAAGRSAGEGPAIDMPVPFKDDGLWAEAVS